jgi:hypothetical protein
MCLLRMDLAGILQNPPNLDSPLCASPALGLFFCGKQNPPIEAGSFAGACRSIYLEVRSRASFSSRSIFC